jgi:hypothetical protein
MTKAHDYATWQALAPVRGAIKGWAFVAADRLPSYLRQGEKQLADLPGDIAEEGQKLLDPIRAAIQSETERRK